MGRGLQKLLRCSDIQTKKTNYNPDTILNRLKATLEVDEGRLESLEYIPPSLSDVKLKAIARYASAADAMAATNALQNTRLPYLNNSPIWLSYIPSVKLTVPKQLFDCLRPKIDSLKNDSPDTRWTIFHSDEGEVGLPKVAIRIGRR